MFDLDLPRAAIATLEWLDLPAGVSEVKLAGSRALRTTRVESQRSRLEHVPLADRNLNLAWKGPAAAAPKGPPLREAVGRIIVRVEETYVSTEVELTLQVLSGEAAEWQLQLPPLPVDAHFDIKTPPRDEPRIQSIVPSADKQTLNGINSVLQHTITIRLKEPSAEPLQVTLNIHQPRPAGVLTVGPFRVLDSLTQKGEIEVHAPEDLRVRYQPAAEVTQREVSQDQRGPNARAVFGYWNVPGSVESSQPVSPLLTLQLEPIKGAVETHVTQILHLERDTDRSLSWKVSTRLDVTPIRTAVDALEVTLPPGFVYDTGTGATPVELAEDVILDRSRQTARVKLAHKQIQPFSLTLTGSYRLQAGQQEASLALVRPRAWSVEHGVASARQFFPFLDRGCEIEVALPEAVEFAARPLRTASEDENPEVSPSIQPLPPKAGSREYSWQGERTPARLNLAWRAHRPDLPVDALVDVTLTGHRGQVREQLHYQFGALRPDHILLRVPTAVQTHLKIVEGGIRDNEEATTPGEWAVNIPATAAKEHILILEYSFALANVPGQNAPPTTKDAPGPFTVPLVRAVQATRGETRVRIWCDPSKQPSLASGAWTELPTEIVPERDSLPMLVARSGPNSGLRLRLAERALTPLAAAVAERILVHATVREGGMQNYHVRYLLSKLSARHLDLHLPILLSISNLDVRMDGKRIPVHFVDEGGREMEVGKVLRLRVEPDLYQRPVLLEVTYRADASLMEGNGLWQMSLRPPWLPGAVLLGRARWQVDLPAGWFPVSPRGDSIVEQRWGWWGWLPAPRPAMNPSELEQWLGGAERPLSVEESPPSLVCWQSALGPLALVYAPQRLWLLICSSLVLAVGLGLVLAPLSRALLWTCLVVIGAAVAAVGVYAPAALPAIAYGSEPGALVLILAIAAQWIQHQRYRRQLIFMPGFTRLKAGSSLIRSGKGPRDPSTIDGPTKRPSSSWPENLETHG
jgi:hypothetical protein